MYFSGRRNSEVRWRGVFKEQKRHGDAAEEAFFFFAEQTLDNSHCSQSADVYRDLWALLSVAVKR